MTNSTEPTIIIPAYCPDERLIQLVRELKDKAGWPVVVVDDGSGQCYYKIFSAVAQTGAVILTHRENPGQGRRHQDGHPLRQDPLPYRGGVG